MKEILIDKKLIILSLVFLAAFVALFLGLLKPQYLLLIRRYEEYRQSQVELAQVAAKRAELDRLKTQEDRLDQALLNAQLLVPDQKETTDFLNQLDGVIRNTGNTLTSLQISEKQNQPKETKEEEGTTTPQTTPTETATSTLPFKEISFSLQINGDFPKLLNLLETLDSLARAVVLPSIVISPSGNLVSTKIEGRIFYK